MRYGAQIRSSCSRVALPTNTTTLEEMVQEMTKVDQEEAKKEAYLKRKGFLVVGPRE